ncbi:hypothetical protein K504DRAFT_490572 [Pleomassaria siparia CBS 279.74]|uniref:Uncharacterized protein n=1 Tax=Pleomassaria siparia CBS 279.74 TaxID=1314801 RepID=A0A6G1KCU6_9PLEO|nr:hypothetical protein K504DRAFT_490572 [Pleomassaria siparia CBS 279.74]
MGRYATLNADTKDIINCLLPGIAANFGADNVVDVIPQEIRMRSWDCARRKHILAETEDDPRNWGVQFLKDLVTISRLNGGNLTEFQDRLRAKVDVHIDEHPWCRLADIKEIREDYEHPPKPPGEVSPVEDSDGSTSEDDYHEELVEPELEKSKSGHRRRRNHEIYETRPQKQPKKRKHSHSTKRLRRDSSEGWERPDMSKRRRQSSRGESSTTPTRRNKGIADRQEFIESSDDDDDDRTLEEIEAATKVARAEFKLRELEHKLAKMRKKVGRSSVETEGAGSMDEPKVLD